MKSGKKRISSKLRSYFLSGEVSETMAKDLIEAFREFANKPKSPVSLLINSTGGSVNDGLAIFDAIKTAPFVVNGIVFGSCMSMAAVILQACDLRVLSPNSLFMIHDGTMTLPRQHLREAIEVAKVVDKERVKINQLLADRTGLSLAKLNRLQKFSTYMTPQEAVNLRFADVILIYPKK